MTSESLSKERENIMCNFLCVAAVFFVGEMTAFSLVVRAAYLPRPSPPTLDAVINGKKQKSVQATAMLCWMRRMKNLYNQQIKRRFRKQISRV